MRPLKIVKVALFTATVLLLPAHGVSAHEAGQGMMGNRSSIPTPGGMGPGMMGYGMGPGMMGYGMGPGMMGYGMGPGMMGYSMGPGMMGYGMGPGMMHQGYGWQSFNGREVSEEDVRDVLGHQLEMRGLTRLKVGKIDSSNERVFKADIVTKEDSLAVRVVIDRRTGFPMAFE